MIREAIYGLYMQDGAENLNDQLWWMFRTSITSEVQDSDHIIDCVALYEHFRSLISGLGKLEHGRCYTFKISYEPQTPSQS